MGSTFTVQVWKRREWDDGYGYEMYWQGQHLIPALIALFKARRLGYGCTTLEWR